MRDANEKKKKKLSNSDRYIEGGVRIIAWFIFPIIFFFSKIILSFDSLVVRLRSTVTPPAPWSNNKAHTQVCIMRNMRYSSAQELNQAINRRAPKWLENASIFHLVILVTKLYRRHLYFSNSQSKFIPFLLHFLILNFFFVLFFPPFIVLHPQAFRSIAQFLFRWPCPVNNLIRKNRKPPTPNRWGWKNGRGTFKNLTRARWFQSGQWQRDENMHRTHKDI